MYSGLNTMNDTFLARLNNILPAFKIHRQIPNVPTEHGETISGLFV